MTTELNILAVRLRLHAYELLNGGANASDLVKDLRAAADHLTVGGESTPPPAALLPASAALQDTRQLVQELTAALQERPDRERTHWAGCHTDPTHRDCAIARLLAALARAPQQEQEDYDEAKRYLTSLFAQVAPQREPLPTLSGLATQFDNYIAGLRAAPLPASAALPDDGTRRPLPRGSAMSETPMWQQIETAPKDGTRVLLAVNGAVLIGRWSDDAALGRCESGPAWQIFECDDCWYSWAEDAPSHWMPLPDPPADQP
jgi:hypothetical protein